MMTLSLDRPSVLMVAGQWYPSPDDGVAGIFVRRHAEAARLVADVAVLHVTTTKRDDASTSGFLFQEEEGILTARVRMKPPMGGLAATQLALWIGSRDGAREVVRQWQRPEIVHLNVAPALGAWTGLRRRLPGTPYVYSEHWSGLLPGRSETLGKLKRRYLRRLVRGAAAVTTPSVQLRRGMEAIGLRGRYELLPNAVDTELFVPGEQRRDGPVRFLHVSRLDANKNPQTIVAATALLVLRGFDVRLDVWGDGPALPEARALAAEYEMGPDRVAFYGPGAPQQIALAMRSADVLVLASGYENAPTVVGEAMASGLPIIAPAVGGIPELVGATRGLLFEPTGGTDALAAAMAAFAAARGHWDPAEIRRHAERTFSLRAVSRQLQRLYETARRS